MTREEFAQKIKKKYPAYSNLDNNILVDKFIAKYPVYKNQIAEETIQEEPAQQTGSVSIGPRKSLLPKETISAKTSASIAPTKEQQKELNKPIVKTSGTGKELLYSTPKEVLTGTLKSIGSTATAFAAPIIDVPANIGKIFNPEIKTPSENLYKALEPTSAGEAETKKFADVIDVMIGFIPATSKLGKIGTKIDDISQIKLTEDQFLDGYNTYLKNYKRVDSNADLFVVGSAEDRMAKLYKQMRESGVKPTVKTKIGVEDVLEPEIAKDVEKATDMQKTWKDITVEQYQANKIKEVNIAKNNNAKSEIAKALTGKKTVGTKKIDGELLAPVEQAQANLDVIFDDITPNVKNSILNSDKPARTFSEFVVNGAETYEQPFRAMINQADTMGVKIDSKDLVDQLVKTSSYKKINDVIVEGLKKNKISIKNNKYKSLSPEFDEYVEAMNDMDYELSKLSDDLSMSMWENIVDEGNAKFANWYNNPMTASKVKANEQKLFQKDIVDITRNAIRQKMDIATGNQFSPIATKRAAYNALLKDSKKLTAKSANKTQKQGIFGKIVDELDFTDLIFPNVTRTALKVGVGVANKTFRKVDDVDKIIKKAFKNITVEPKKSPVIPKRQALPTGTGRTEVNQPIITPAPTTYEKPAAKIGTTDTSIVEAKASSMSSELIEEAKKIRETTKKGDLFALHNLKDNDLAKVIESGNMPYPSIAITKKSINYDDFGDITLVGNAKLVDPKNPKVSSYTGDVYTVRVPKPEYNIKNIDPETIDNLLDKNNVRQYLYEDIDSSKIARDMKYEINSGIPKNSVLYSFETKFKPDAPKDLLKNIIDEIYGKPVINIKKTNPTGELSNLIKDKKIKDIYSKSEDFKDFKLQLQNDYNVYDAVQNYADKKGMDYYDYIDSLEKDYGDFLPYTSENIVKRLDNEIQLGSDIRGTEGTFFMNNKVFAHKKINTLDDYHKYKELLTGSEKKQTSFDKKEDNFVNKYSRRFNNFDQFRETIQDILKNNLYENKLENIIKIENLVEPRIKDISTFRKDIEDLYGKGVTTKYFEAKIKDVVGLDQFDGVLIPDNTGDDIIKLLEDKGVKKIVKYNSSIEGDRVKKLNKFFKDSMFALVPALIGTGVIAVSSD